VRQFDRDLVVVGPVAAVAFTAAFATTVTRSGTTKISNPTPKFHRQSGKDVPVLAAILVVVPVPTTVFISLVLPPILVVVITPVR
jgi:hypothetical protein